MSEYSQNAYFSSKCMQNKIWIMVSYNLCVIGMYLTYVKQESYAKYVSIYTYISELLHYTFTCI